MRPIIAQSAIVAYAQSMPERLVADNKAGVNIIGTTAHLSEVEVPELWSSEFGRDKAPAFGVTSPSANAFVRDRREIERVGESPQGQDFWHLPLPPSQLPGLAVVVPGCGSPTRQTLRCLVGEEGVTLLRL